MALTKTLAEIKEQIPKLVSNLSADSMFANFERAEAKYLVPITGIDLYNDIQAKYNAANLTPEETTLLKKMRLAYLPLAFRDEIGLGTAMISDTGLKRVGTRDGSPARFEFLELKESLLSIAHDGIDNLISHLFEVEPALWLASKQYEQIKSLMVRTGEEFSRHYHLFQPARTFWTVRGLIESVQIRYMEKSIGKDLFAHLVADRQTEVAAKAEIVTLLQRAIVHFTVQMACSLYQARFDDNGFSVLSPNLQTSETMGRQAASADQIDMARKELERMGQDSLGESHSLLVAYRKDETKNDNAFDTAFDKGPLVTYINPVDRSSGNDEYKGIFTMI